MTYDKNISMLLNTIKDGYVTFNRDNPNELQAFVILGNGSLCPVRVKDFNTLDPLIIDADIIMLDVSDSAPMLDLSNMSLGQACIEYNKVCDISSNRIMSWGYVTPEAYLKEVQWTVNNM